jgi:energy-coupling factor transport system permease protein
MTLFFYLDKGTWFHRLDPRTKIIAVVILFVMALTFNHPVYVAVVSLAIVMIAICAKSLANFWRVRYLLVLLVVFSTVLWPFFTTGPTPFIDWGPIVVSLESVLYAIAMGLRLATFVGTGLVFLSTTTNEEFTEALIYMKLPYPIAFAFSTSLRLLPTFAGAGATIVQAQISRGLDLETGNILQKMRKFIPLAVPLFIYSIRHTNLLAMALESRGFDPQISRSWYIELKMKPFEYLLMLGLLVVMVVMLYLRFQGLGMVLPRL